MNKYITKENIYNRAYKQILVNHSKAYKKYYELKYEEDDNKRGIALYNSNSLKRATSRIQKAFQTSYDLTGLKELKSALNIIEEFVKEPVIMQTSLASVTKIANVSKIKIPYNDPRINCKNSMTLPQYKMIEQLQTYLNSACKIEPIFIENSFQFSLALLKRDFNPTMNNKEINNYVNTTCNNLVEKYNLNIEFPYYTLGRLVEHNLKMKTIFCRYTLYEVNEKSKKVMHYETNEFKELLDELLKVAFPRTRIFPKYFDIYLSYHGDKISLNIKRQ